MKKVGFALFFLVGLLGSVAFADSAVVNPGKPVLVRESECNSYKILLFSVRGGQFEQEKLEFCSREDAQDALDLIQSAKQIETGAKDIRLYPFPVFQ